MKNRTPTPIERVDEALATVRQRVGFVEHELENRLVMTRGALLDATDFIEGMANLLIKHKVAPIRNYRAHIRMVIRNLRKRGGM
ncbi:MAG TPA: hypothetical protein VGM94_01210 [Galbitalea sp.]